MTDLIKVIRGYARLKLRGSDVQYFAGQLTNLAHRLLGFGVEKIDFGPIKALLSPRYARFGIVRVRYRLRDGTSRRKWIDRPDGAGKRMGRERVIEPGSWIGFRKTAFRGVSLVHSTILRLALRRLV